MTDEEITTARRGLRKVLRKDEIATMNMLHRSAESRYLFQKASRRASEEGSDELTIINLLTELLSNLPAEYAPLFKNKEIISLKDEEEWPSYLIDPLNPVISSRSFSMLNKDGDFSLCVLSHRPIPSKLLNYP